MKSIDDIIKKAKELFERIFGTHLHSWDVTRGASGEPIKRKCKCGSEQWSTINGKWNKIDVLKPIIFRGQSEQPKKRKG